MGHSLNVLIVTDPLDFQRSYEVEDNYSEGYPKHIIDDIKSAISERFQTVSIVEGVSRFVKSVGEYNGVVVPCYFGPASPNSKSIVPAACEATGLPYIGADAHTQALCNDKYVSRLFARDCGMRVPGALLVRNVEDIDANRFNRVRYPVVVKPNYGGGSNGIGEANLCRDSRQAMEVSRLLLESQGIAVLIEEYVAGHEVQVVFAKLRDGLTLVGQAEVTIANQDVFDCSIFGIESKKRKAVPVSLEIVERVSSSDIEVMRRVANSFEKVGFMRIDCRVDERGDAWLIELSPDCSLVRGSGLFLTFDHYGYTYPDMFEQLIESSLQ